MKMHLYLSIIVSVLLLGFILTYFRDREKISGTAGYIYTESPQEFQDQAQYYAERTRTGPIAEWLVYGGGGDAIMVDGIDSEGQQIIKCVFDKNSRRPLSILRVVWKGADLSGIPKTKGRETAEWWLKQVVTADEGGWHYVRDGQPSPYRYVSMWRSKDYDASLSVNTKTGQLIGLRLNPPNVRPGRLKEQMVVKR